MSCGIMKIYWHTIEASLTTASEVHVGPMHSGDKLTGNLLNLFGGNYRSVNRSHAHTGCNKLIILLVLLCDN